MNNPYNFNGLLGGFDPRGFDPLRGQSLMGQPARMPAPSDATLSLQQRMQPQQGLLSRAGSGFAGAASGLGSGFAGAARGLGRSFTGEGSSARLSALGASLLQGPSRTPISLGSSLAQGLLAGNIAAQHEEERKFKRGLLEQEMAYKEAQLMSGKGDKRINFVDIYKKDPETQRFNIMQTVRQEDAKKYEANSDFRIVPYGKAYETRTDETGVDLSKDTMILPDGSVKVIENSKTAQQLELQGEGLLLSKEKFAQRQKEFDKKMALDEARAQVDADIKERNIKLSESEYNLKVEDKTRKIQNEKIIEERKQDAAYSSLGQIIRSIGSIEKTLADNKDSFIPLTGIGSALADLPLGGAQTPQGVFKNQVEELRGFLTGKGLEKLKTQSKTGATGFGALNKEELEIIKGLEGRLNLANTREEFDRVLNDVKTRFGALYYGVLGADGVIQPYSPSKHDIKLFDGSLEVYTPPVKVMEGARRLRFENGTYKPI